MGAREDARDLMTRLETVMNNAGFYDPNPEHAPDTPATKRELLSELGIPVLEEMHVVLTCTYQTQTGVVAYASGNWKMTLNPGATRFELLSECKQQMAKGAGVPASALAVLFFTVERNELT